MIINESIINLSAVELSIDKNLTLLDSTMTFNSSTIITKGCITISNTKIKVDLSNANIKLGQLLLMNSTSKCLTSTGTFSIVYFNQPQCTQSTSELNSLALIVTFTNESNCEKSPLATWIIILIVICSVVGLAIIVIVIVVLILPDLRRKIFSKNVKPLK